MIKKIQISTKFIKFVEIFFNICYYILTRNIMKKIKVLKSLPENKKSLSKTYKKNRKYKYMEKDKFSDKYLQYYDDIKIPSQKYDW